MRNGVSGSGLVPVALTVIALSGAWPVAPVSAQTEEPVDADVLNYAFANQLGSGIYTVSGHTVQIYRVPFYLPIRDVEERSPGLKVTLPVSLGFFDLDPEDPALAETPEHVATATFVPGVAVQFAALENWWLEPFVELGLAQDFHEHQRAYLYSVGLGSLVRFLPRGLEVRLGNRVVYAGEHTPGSEIDEDFAMLESGLELRHPLPLDVKGHGIDWGPYVMNYLYLEPTKVFLTGEPLDIGAQYEVGVTFGTQQPLELWRFTFPRLGLGYRFGEDASAIRLVLGAAF